MSLHLRIRNWRRAAPRAWQQLPLLQPTKIAGCIAISLLNILWNGHGVFRSWHPGARIPSVLLASYLLVTAAEFIWLLLSTREPVNLGFPEEPAATPLPPEVDPLVEQLRVVPAPVLKEGTLQLADAMRTFEAGSDGAFVSTLLRPSALGTLSEEQRDEEIDRESKELQQHHLATWRVYRDRFYRPARAFRDELRKRLGIKNPRREPEIPALDQAALTGAKPITEAADHLTELANRLP
ncbi:MAG: hypothetical protein M3Z18_03985 [Gemmatimonadota bacterium]|nr:hypothetical protein [Gemmatimonadota bacterium]